MRKLLCLTFLISLPAFGMNPNKPELPNKSLPTWKTTALVATIITTTTVCFSATVVATPVSTAPCTLASLALMHSIYAANDFSDLFKKAEKPNSKK